MLTKLKISNYILIDNLVIDFDKGLNIFTGETGSGKSIIINSLKFFVLSNKNKSIFLDETKPCKIEANFTIDKAEWLDSIVAKNNLEITDNIILTKEISTNLKSTYYINGKKMPLNIFKNVANYMLDFHLQNETYNYISCADSRCKLLDEYGGITNLIETQYAELFKHYREYKLKISSLQNILNSQDIDKDYIEYQLSEFAKIDLSTNLKEKLEEEYKILTNKKLSEDTIAENIEIMEGDAIGIIPNVKKILRNLASLKLEHIDNLSNRINNIHIELLDCLDELKINLHNIDLLSDKSLDTIKSKLDLIYSLEQKYKVSSITQLIKKKEELEEKINSIDSINLQIEDLKKSFKIAEEKLITLIREITDLRTKIAKMLQEDVCQQLPFVGMPEANFNIEVSIIDFDNINHLGCNDIILKFAALKDSKCEPLIKTASGGELARLVLILKGLIASKSIYSKTLILDEVDTGISGAIAMKTGKLIEKFAQNMQIIIITHLPQVASRKGAHHLVYKENTNSIQVKRLATQKERVGHIAAMISGEENISVSALQHAEELIIQ